MDEKDLFEDYDIRMNSSYISLLLAEQKDSVAKKDHKEALPTKRIKTLPTMDYLRKYSEMTLQSPKILPSGCRYVEPIGNGDYIYIIEQQPQFRTVAMALNFDLMYSEIKSKKLLKEYGIEGWLSTELVQSSQLGYYYKLNLAFPYVIFLMYINKHYQIQMGCSFLRVNPMIGLSDYLLKIPLSNISDNQSICFGSRLNNSTYNTAAEAIDATINIFWTSVFNADYIYNIKAYDNVAGISNFLEWQYLSRLDPMFIYRVDWIKHNKNIFEMIESTKQYMGGASKNSNPDTIYHDFISAFTSPVKIGEITTGKIRKKVEPLYYDVSNGIYLNDILRAEVGDSFTNESKSKEYHIVSFIGVSGKDPQKVRLSYKGKLFNYKLNNISKDYFGKRISAKKYLPSIKMRNGVVIKSDDIIKYTNKAGAELYRRVFYIREGLDGRAEVRLGNQYYIAANLPENAELFNQDKPNIYGLDLVKGSEYYYSGSASNNNKNVMIHQVERCSYNGIDVGQENKLIFQFISRDRAGRTLNIPMNNLGDTSRKLFPPLAVKKGSECINPSMISVGRGIRRISLSEGGHEERKKVFKTPSGYIHFANTRIETSNKSDIRNLIINDEKFQIDTHFGLLEHNIGDLVVVANWKDPLSVLNIRRIQGFKVEDKGDYTNLSFILMDKNGALSEEIFVSNQIVRIGYIRKIVTKFEELSSGTKIIATDGNISNFPKKDVNIVIGIIVDGPNPLVLCSNGCTLWYQDVMEKFKHIPMSSAVWKTKDHTPLDLRKIKFQAGDVVIPSYADSSKDHGYLMIQTNGSKSLKYHPLSYYSNGGLESYVADKSFQDECVLDCIPNPRIGKLKQDIDGFIPANPNFHGGFVPVEGSAFLYVTDPRSLIDV
jgi:hypothetical protein